MIQYGPLLYHCIWILVSDYYFHLLTLKTVGSSIGYQVAMLLYLFNFTYAQQIHRLFSCSYEAILGIISLYYYQDITAEFDRNTVIVIALQSLSFVVRNTSPIGWVPILLCKV